MLLTLANQNTTFLIDTGAELSVLPYFGNDPPCDKTLVAAIGSPIRTFGNKSVNVLINGQSYPWSFILAEVKRPLIGADFLRHYSFLVDVSRNCLIHATSLNSYPLKVQRGAPPRLAHLETPRSPWTALLAKFPSISKPEFSGSVKHQVQHRIETTGFPPSCKPRRLSPSNLLEAKKAFAELLRLQIVRRSNSPYQSPLVLVDKADGSKRVCGDFSRLNSQTKPDGYPIPHLHDFTTQLQGCTIFTKIDLVRGYHQIPMHPSDIEKTAIATPFGSFEYVRMPYGLQIPHNLFKGLWTPSCKDCRISLYI